VNEHRRRYEAARASSSELENHYIDELRAGTISRREFVRRATTVGMSTTMAGFLLTACGSGSTENTQTDDQAQAEVRPGGTMRASVVSPTSALDPVKIADQGGLSVLGQSGEYLADSKPDLTLAPRLAESWRPSRDASQWTFKIRQGVRFHDGRAMTADDVAATINRLADPKNSSNSLSLFTGIVGKGAAQATDPTTVTVELEAPTANFPYYLSSDDSYNTIILPRDYDGDWERTFIGTGPFRREAYTQGRGVTYTKNPEYWDRSRVPTLDGSEMRFYAKEQAQILALQGGEIDIVSQYSVSGGKAISRDQNFRTLEVRGSQHRQIHMRTDREPFDDKRVRQAVALLIDRRALVQGLFDGKSDLGNDSPFAPVFPSTDKSVPQRQQDVAKAKQLLADAGMPDGFDIVLRTYDVFELPDVAQLIQDNLRQGNIRVKLNITDSASYYGDATFGKSPWLDSTFGITDYGHRGVPDAFLKAPLRSDGIWNAAHFKNEEYDRLVDDYLTTLDLETQRATAGKIQRLLQDETPIIFPYFYFYLGATKANVSGARVSPMGHVEMEQAGFTS
jgi:peptide/nickel transport system substrate-binding protein